jgi:pimeloyl-ACP methyl ester carboxylesterase
MEKAFICGYSTGGSIALEFLLTAPERALGGVVIGGISEVRNRQLNRAIKQFVYISIKK